MGQIRSSDVWKLLGERKISDTEFARGVGETPQSVYNWKERGFIPHAKAAAVARYLGQSLDAMLGLIRIAEPPPAGYLETGQDYLVVDMVSGPILQPDGRIGWAREESLRRYAFQREWLKEKGLAGADLRMIEIHGSSNAPWLLHGDVALVHIGDTLLRQGEGPTENVFALQYADHARIKRMIAQHDGSVLLRSYNSDKNTYPDERIPAEDIDGLGIIGRVVWRGG